MAPGRRKRTSADATHEALRCVERFHRRFGWYFGVGLVARWGPARSGSVQVGFERCVDVKNQQVDVSNQQVRLSSNDDRKPLAGFFWHAFGAWERFKFGRATYEMPSKCDSEASSVCFCLSGITGVSVGAQCEDQASVSSGPVAWMELLGSHLGLGIKHGTTRDPE